MEVSNSMLQKIYLDVAGQHVSFIWLSFLKTLRVRTRNVD